MKGHALHGKISFNDHIGRVETDKVMRESDWTEGGAFWQVGVPEVSDLESVTAARVSMDAGLEAQRRGI